MSRAEQRFGGNWTEEKLLRVKKYLRAYTTIMAKQKFKFAYIDAFAGTGYRKLHMTPRKAEDLFDLMMPDLAGKEPQAFLHGSARIALEIEPRFDRYLFIEKSETRFRELAKLREEYPTQASSIILYNADANVILNELCARDWTHHRAVLFLDPFGMQVEWKTIEAIAKTKAIDLWILFPLGAGVNRLLRRDADIPQRWRDRLDTFFGTKSWESEFYKDESNLDLFDGVKVTRKKVASFESIGQYFVKRLKDIFPAVAENPLPLQNKKGNPLFLLCFAAANVRGGKTAVKIAQHILKA
jgi:three-Cys-motif partner protein